MDDLKERLLASRIGNGMMLNNPNGPEAVRRIRSLEAGLKQAALDLHEAAGRFAVHTKLDLLGCSELTRDAARKADATLRATLSDSR